MKINVLFFISLINFIFPKVKITELQKIKARACMKLQSKKYKEDEEIVTAYIEHMSKELKVEPRQILYMSLSICYKIIPDELARIIHKHTGDIQIDKNNTLLTKIYNFEYYNFDNVKFIKDAFQEFMFVFEILREEMNMQKREFEDFHFTFVHSPLFKLFMIYFLINTIIIFYRRIKYPPAFNNNANKDKKEDNKKNQYEEKKSEKTTENKIKEKIN